MKRRSFEEFRSQAVLHWPEHVRDRLADISILPALLETQEQFIAVLKLADSNPLAWQAALGTSGKLTRPLFLKHLMVLSDFGGEPIDKIVPLRKLLGGDEMRFGWKDGTATYRFDCLADAKSATPNRLGVDGKGVFRDQPNKSGLVQDATMFLMFAGLSINNDIPSDYKDKCVAGSLLGCEEEIDQFVRQNYIRVSRIMQGGTANQLGAETQKFVRDELARTLQGWKIVTDASLPGVVHTAAGAKTNFDVVARSPSNKLFGIEVSFQVTTNSTIERKSKEAWSVQQAVHGAGHKVCYVLDGAGNINVRQAAVRRIFDHSDCTVAFSEQELARLAEYMKSVEGGA